MFDPSLKETSQRRLTGSVQNGQGERMNRSLQFIKIREKKKRSLFYPTSNPVDSTGSKVATNEHSEQGNSCRALRRKVDALRRSPNRKPGERRMIQKAKAQSNV